MSKTTMQSFEDDSQAVSGGFLRMERHAVATRLEGVQRYSTGEWIGPDGIVSVYVQNGITRLDFAYGGRLHIRTWQKRWGDRTIPRLAWRFVRDILDGQKP